MTMLHEGFIPLWRPVAILVLSTIFTVFRTPIVSPITHASSCRFGTSIQSAVRGSLTRVLRIIATVDPVGGFGQSQSRSQRGTLMSILQRFDTSAC